MAAAPPFDLFLLSPPRVLWPDRDRDGLPDGVGLTLGVAPRLADPGIWAELLNLTARLAAGSLALPAGGLVTLERGPAPGRLWVAAPSRRASHPARLEKLPEGGFRLTGREAPALAGMLAALARSGEPGPRPRAWREVLWSGRAEVPALARDARGRTLARLTVPALAAPPAGVDDPAPAGDPLALSGRLFAADPADPRGVTLALGLELAGERLPAGLGLALARLVGRLCLAATRYRLPLARAGAGPAAGPLLVVAPGPGPAELVVRDDGALLARGEARRLGELLALWGELALAGREARPPARDWLGLLAQAREFLAGRGEAGAWARALARGETPPPASPRFLPRARAACRRLALAPPARLAPPPVLGRSWSDQGEVAGLLKLLAEYPAGQGPLELLAFSSKPRPVRANLAARLRRELARKGYRPAVRVLNAYKPGLSWLREVVLPRLAGRTEVARFSLTCRPFATGDPRQLEMEGRWLQEAHPGPELLARALNWPLERVELGLDPGQGPAYRARAYDRAGGLVLDEGLAPLWAPLPQLPGRGGGCGESGSLAHPTRSGVVIRTAGGANWTRGLPSDREAFWRRFTGEWLPTLEKAMVEALPGLLGSGAPAFWKELLFTVEIEESEERLGILEERVGPMEALHEDLYFGLLDFFRRFAEDHGLPPGLQLGQVVPRVASRSRGGRPRARLAARPWAGYLAPAPGAEEAAPAAGLAWRGRGPALRVAARPSAGAAPEALARAARALGVPLAADPAGDFWLALPRPPAGASLPAPPGRPAPPSDRHIFTVAASAATTAHLARQPLARLWPGDSSFQGRAIPALELFWPEAGEVSAARARLARPTLLVNARHHANEVSSTNAALRLAWWAGHAPRGRALLKRVNLAVIPLENPDGAATLERLLPTARGHKLHAARYNALGIEWYPLYFENVPIFPEARVKAGLWARWLPALMLDLHGVPSHEWEQPFAGYLNYRFREYWIPRSFIYAIVPFIDRPEHPGHPLARRLAGEVAARLGAEPDLAALNARMNLRYEYYARRLAPEVFPASRSRELMVVPLSERIRPTNFGERHYPLTESELITEVLDEVAEGTWLSRCVRAHLRVAQALLAHLAARGGTARVTARREAGGLVLAWERGPRRADPAGR